MKGKPVLPGLPATFGGPEDVSTLVVHLKDDINAVEIDLMYSLFFETGALARSMTIRNKGEQQVSIERAYGLSLDVAEAELEMVGLQGEWARETRMYRRRVEYGHNGYVMRYVVGLSVRFESLTGYSSHLHNPFFALVHPSTSEDAGPAWGYSLIYSGSFSANIDRFATGFTRLQLGLNPLHLSWPLKAGESFTTPEVVAVFSTGGLGGMSQKMHHLYRHHLSRSPWTLKDRPALLNSWEGRYFDINHDNMVEMAKNSADLGVKLFVMDDGWFGDKHPRNSDQQGLGDWMMNPSKFPHGLEKFVTDATASLVMGNKEPIRFGIWVEPEMVNPKSELYERHPDWALRCGRHPESVRRNQLVLNLGLPAVQNYIIDFMTAILSSGPISYVKWDNNRGMHEMSHPSDAHRYMLGVYHVFETLTSRFPDVLWEGCASGGGRFDPGMLHYFPQSWTSDNTDALERLHIQFGTSLAYPASSMGGHVSVVPNHQVGRVTPFEFRAHVAMMCGSFGFELDPANLSTEEKEMVPKLVALQARLSSLVIGGTMLRLASPETNYPAVLFLSEDGAKGVLMAYAIMSTLRPAAPTIRLRGLDNSTYRGRLTDWQGLTRWLDADARWVESAMGGRGLSKPHHLHHAATEVTPEPSPALNRYNSDPHAHHYSSAHFADLPGAFRVAVFP